MLEESRKPGGMGIRRGGPEDSITVGAIYTIDIDDWILDGETMEADEYMSKWRPTGHRMHPPGHRGSEKSTDLPKAMELPKAWNIS